MRQKKRIGRTSGLKRSASDFPPKPPNPRPFRLYFLAIFGHFWTILTKICARPANCTQYVAISAFKKTKIYKTSHLGLVEP